MAHKAVPLITLLSSPSEIVHPSTFAYNRLGLAGNHQLSLLSLTAHTLEQDCILGLPHAAACVPRPTILHVCYMHGAELCMMSHMSGCMCARMRLLGLKPYIEVNWVN